MDAGKKIKARQASKAMSKHSHTLTHTLTICFVRAVMLLMLPPAHNVRMHAARPLMQLLRQEHAPHNHRQALHCLRVQLEAALAAPRLLLQQLHPPLVARGHGQADEVGHALGEPPPER